MEVLKPEWNNLEYLPKVNSCLFGSFLTQPNLGKIASSVADLYLVLHQPPDQWVQLCSASTNITFLHRSIHSKIYDYCEFGFKEWKLTLDPRNTKSALALDMWN